jgi:uncharacterized cupredoxin-like copper-binding protein
MARHARRTRALEVLVALCLAGSFGTGVIGPAQNAAAEPVRVIDVHMTQEAGPDGPWSIEPRVINVTSGETVQFRVYNNGTLVHDFYLDAPYNVSTGPIVPGRETTMEAITFGEPSNGSVPVVSFWCEVPGHRQLGMMGNVNVAPAPAEHGTAPWGAPPGSSPPQQQPPQVGVGPLLGWASIAAAFVFFGALVLGRRPTH